jgi:hypothetical protein
MSRFGIHHKPHRASVARLYQSWIVPANYFLDNRSARRTLCSGKVQPISLVSMLGVLWRCPQPFSART